jgi:hypothetical protein
MLVQRYRHGLWLLAASGVWYCFSSWYSGDHWLVQVSFAMMVAAEISFWLTWPMLGLDYPSNAAPVYRKELIGDTWVIFDAVSNEVVGWSRTEPSEQWLKEQSASEGGK